MREILRFMDIRSTDPTYNLALEEYLLTHYTQGEILLLWQNANTIVIGRNQNTEEEINRAFVEEHNITVVRRTTGGGAVYHDMGNLNYSFIQDSGDPETMSIAALAVPVVKALARWGCRRRCPDETIFWWTAKRFPVWPRDCTITVSCITERCCSPRTPIW